jgi:hypothetical protein
MVWPGRPLDDRDAVWVPPPPPPPAPGGAAASGSPRAAPASATPAGRASAAAPFVDAVSSTSGEGPRSQRERVPLSDLCPHEPTLAARLAAPSLTPEHRALRARALIAALERPDVAQSIRALPESMRAELTEALRAAGRERGTTRAAWPSDERIARALAHLQPRRDDPPVSNVSAPGLGTVPTAGTAIARPDVRPSELRALSEAAPPEVRAKAVSLFGAYGRLATEALAAEAFAERVELVDRFASDSGDAPVRPDDRADAAYRTSLALYSVLRDLEQGRLTPELFGVPSWAEVDGARLAQLALARLEAEPSLTHLDEEMRTRLAEWMPQREVDGGRQPVRAEGFAMTRDSSAYREPERAAQRLAEHGLGRASLERAAAVADAAPGARDAALEAATLDQAHALAEGQLGRANAAAVLPAILELTETSPFAAALPLPPNASAPDGFEVTEVEGRRVAYRLKTTHEIALEVDAKLARGDLDHLSPAARDQLVRQLGLGSATPGASLEAQLKGERGAQLRRVLVGQVLETAVLCVASGGVAGLTAKALAAPRFARVGAQAKRLATFTMGSASFTVMAGLRHGKLEPKDFVVDAAMFKLLGSVSRLARGLAAGLPAETAAQKITQYLLAEGLAVAGVTGSMAGLDAATALAAKGDLRWKDVLDRLPHHLANFTALHAMFAIATRMGHRSLVRDHERSLRELEVGMQTIEAAIQRGDVLAAERGLRALAEVEQRLSAMRSDLLAAARERGGAALESAVAAELAAVDAQLGRAGELGPRTARLQALEARVGRPATRKFGEALGEEGLHALEALVDGVVNEKPAVAKEARAQLWEGLTQRPTPGPEAPERLRVEANNLASRARKAKEAAAKETQGPFEGLKLPPAVRGEVLAKLKAAQETGAFDEAGLQRWAKMASGQTELAVRQLMSELDFGLRVVREGRLHPQGKIVLSAKAGQTYELAPGRKERVDSVAEFDVLFLDAEGVVQGVEVKHTAKALRDKVEEQGPGYLKAMQEWATARPGRQASVVIATSDRWVEIFQPGRGTDWGSPARIAAEFGLGLELAERRFSGSDLMNLESRWREGGQDRYWLGIDWIEGNKLR